MSGHIPGIFKLKFNEPSPPGIASDDMASIYIYFYVPRKPQSIMICMFYTMPLVRFPDAVFDIRESAILCGFLQIPELAVQNGGDTALRELDFSFLAIRKECNHTENSLLIMNQTEFLLVHNKKKIVSTIT